MGKVIGIDLGTTNSVVAVMEAGQPVVIANEEGDRTTPSVIAYSESGDRLVGNIAKRQAITNAERTVYSIKRFMGRKFNEVSDERRYVPYSVIEGPGGDARIEINKHVLSPQEISAEVLLKLRRAAEDYLGEAVGAAVLTVPAYFNDAQRQATREAGTIAGLEVKRIVNEPTAAAMAYGLDKKRGEKIAIFDFGGGTFDISVLEVGDDIVRVLATNGDTHLGGDDIDDRIVSWLLSEFQQESGIDLSQNRMVLQLLKGIAEKTKIELSFTLAREIHLPFLAVDATGPRHLVRELSRAHLEMMIEDLVARTLEPTRKCLADARLSPAQIDEVVLVGGSTRIPMVQETVRRLFGREPNRSVNPDEVVAVGAAVQAGVLTGEVKDLLLLDVTPLSLGVETQGGLMSRIIERNTTIPARETETFTTAVDGQTLVDVHVLQGERELAKDNRTLGRFRLTGIPPNYAGVPQIHVTFDIDANGIVQVSAKDTSTAFERHLQISHATSLAKEDVERMVKVARLNEAEDRRKRATIESQNRAEHLLARAFRFMEENERALGHAAALIRAAVLRLQNALAAREGIDQAIERLENTVGAMSTTLKERSLFPDRAGDDPLKPEDFALIDTGQDFAQPALTGTDNNRH